MKGNWKGLKCKTRRYKRGTK